MKTLESKVVALTGAASGIGRSLAIQLSGQGALLALCDIDEAGLEATSRQIGSTAAVTTSIVDVSDRNQVEKWSSETADVYGSIDVVINNAGVTTINSVEEVSYEDFQWVLDTNFFGVLHAVKSFLPHLRERPEAHIVNIASVNSFLPFPYNGPYNCAKHAVKALSQTLMQELADTNIHVTTVLPGGIKTNIVRNSRYQTDVYGKTQEDAIARFEKRAGTTPDRASRLVIRAILKNKSRLLIGADARVMDWMARLMPTRYASWIGKLALKPDSKSAGD